MKETTCQTCSRTVVNPGELYAQCGVCTSCMQTYEDSQYTLTWQEKVICALFRSAKRGYTNGYGPDPYAGETYKWNIGKLSFKVSNVVCWSASVFWGRRTLYMEIVDSYKEFNWLGRKMVAVVDALEHEYQVMYQCDGHYGLEY